VKTPPDGFRAQYRALIERIHQTAPAASVLCVGTWRSSKDGQELDSIIYDECQGENAKMVSLTDLYEWTDSRGPVGRPIYLGGGVGDNFHPNDAGYSAITKRIVESVQFSE
jgi:lysophospholipase L1-like esterase